MGGSVWLATGPPFWLPDGSNSCALAVCANAKVTKSADMALTEAMPIGAGVGSFRTLMLSVTSFSWFVQSSYAMSKRRTQVQIISFLLKKVASHLFCLHRAGHGDVSPVSLLSDRHAYGAELPT